MIYNAAILVDPSRTSSIYRPMAVRLGVAFDSIKAAVDRLVRVNDEFLLAQNASDESKLKGFLRWARAQSDGKLKGLPQKKAWQEYVKRGFHTGVNRSYASVLLGQSRKSAEYEKGALARFTYADAEKLDKVRLLVTRTYSELDNITERMSTSMGRILADGFVKGNSPSRLAGELVDSLDIEYKRALAIARTEIVRAQAEGQLLAFERLGVTRLKAIVEWTTAKEGVCERCSLLRGKTFTLKEAAGLIPLHTNCRCAWSVDAVRVNRMLGGPLPDDKSKKSKRKPVKVGGKKR